jgi:hypothetical protein
MLPTYDTALWPVVVVALGEARSEAEWQTHIERLEMYTARGPCAFVFDGRKGVKPTSAERNEVNAFHHRSARERPGRIRAIGLVMASAVDVAALTAIRWFMPAHVPMKAFTSLEEAVAWARPLALAKGVGDLDAV